MKVLVVESAGGLWGSERALLDLIASASKVEFAVCCPPRTLLANELARRKVRVFPWFIERLHEKSRLDRLRAAWGVWRACTKFEPDLIHVNQSGAYRVVQLPARMLGLPIICHIRIFEDVAYLAACKPDGADLRGMIAISHSIEDEIRRFPRLASIPVHTIYDAYARSQPRAAERRGKRVACVGRVTPIKGQEILLSALSHVDVECLIAGDGPVDYVRQLKARSHAHWIGFVEDVASLLHSCRGLVCPSHREPLGRVILEAWDAGSVPIVFAGSGGAAEVVAAANGGILYAEQTPECLAKALAEVTGLSEDEAGRFVANGRAWMERECSPSAYGSRLTDLFRRSVIARQTG